MTAFEYIKTHAKEMKGKPFKEQWAYFLDYYALGTAIVLVILIVAVVGIVRLANKPEQAFGGVFLNTTSNEAAVETYMDDFAAYAEIDTAKYSLLADTSMILDDLTFTDPYSYYTIEKIMAQVYTGDIDTISADEATFTYLSYQNILMDLRTALSREQLALVEDDLYYMDLTTFEKMQAAADELTSYDGPVPDPRDPAFMEDPVPVGIYLEDATEDFAEAFPNYAGDPVIGICSTGGHRDFAADFVLYAFGISE